jgi:hypothetical protein
MQCMSSKIGFKLQVKRSGAAMAFIAMPHPCGGKMVIQPLLALLCNAEVASLAMQKGGGSPPKGVSPPKALLRTGCVALATFPRTPRPFG